VNRFKMSLASQAVSAALPSDLVDLQILARILQRRWSSGSQPVEQVLVEWSHMPASLATWGKATSQAGGNVSNTDAVSAADGEHENEAEEDKASPIGSPRSRHTVRPNPKTSGPQWVN
jgi:hypothetical protein